jgi:hypothetical protein
MAGRDEAVCGGEVMATEPVEGPRVMTIRAYHCQACRLHRGPDAHVWAGLHYCKHPDSLGAADRRSGFTEQIIGDTDRTPLWCPLVERAAVLAAREIVDENTTDDVSEHVITVQLPDAESRELAWGYLLDGGGGTAIWRRATR